VRSLIKTALLIIVASFLATSCTTFKHLRKVKKVSAERAVKECREPNVFHMIPPTSFGVSLRILRHKDCMEIPDMLMVIWDGEKTELNETVAKVIMLMYVDSININNEKQTGWVFLKSDKIQDGLHVQFYELVEIDPEDYRGNVE